MMTAPSAPMVPHTATSTVAEVYIEREDALVTLKCGHSYSVAATKPPRVGQDAYCWRCAAGLRTGEVHLVSEFAFDLLRAMDR